MNTYMEFAAVYLELRYFRSNLRPTYFPAIRDFSVVNRLLAQDVDADMLFQRTRLEGAPDPVISTDTSSDESHDYYYKLLRHAERARAEGDNVRAGILHTKAARAAPVARMQPTLGEAIKDMQALTDNMTNALKFSPEEVQEWLRVLPALLDKSDQGNWPVEAKLLFDLQEVCMEHQRRTFVPDLIEWVLTGGKRDIMRPLTSLQFVRTTKHLRNAAKRLTLARVSDEDRQRLARLLQSAEQLAESRVARTLPAHPARRAPGCGPGGEQPSRSGGPAEDHRGVTGSHPGVWLLHLLRSARHFVAQPAKTSRFDRSLHVLARGPAPPAGSATGHLDGGRLSPGRVLSALAGELQLLVLRHCHWAFLDPEPGGTVRRRISLANDSGNLCKALRSL